MQIEEFFDIQSANIRVKGTEIGIETVLPHYLFDKMTPEQIVPLFPTLELKDVYATILYYLMQPEQVGAYLLAHAEGQRDRGQETDQNPPHLVSKLRELKTILSPSEL